MKRTCLCLTLVLLVTVAFSQVGCKSAGPLARGQAGVQIGVASPGTKVYVDSRCIGTVQRGKHGPIAYVPAGPHTLTAKAEGYEPRTMPIYAYPGHMAVYDLPLLSEWTPLR